MDLSWEMVLIGVPGYFGVDVLVSVLHLATLRGAGCSSTAVLRSWNNLQDKIEGITWKNHSHLAGG